MTPPRVRPAAVGRMGIGPGRPRRNPFPYRLPTTTGMADELSRSLASNLREHGFAVILAV
jgi:hypothetical protein